MEPIVFSLLLAVLGIAVLYFVVKEAVKAGIKEAYGDLNVYLRNLIANGINEADRSGQGTEEAGQQEQKEEKKLDR